MGNSWTEISGDLTRQLDRNKLHVMGRIWGVEAVEKNASTSFYGNIVSLAESPVKKGLLYAGTDDGLINVTENDGKSWKRIESFPGVPDTSYVSYITASHFDANTVYASFDNHKRGDFKPYILKSTDAGKTWKSISGNLPENGYVHVITEDFKDPNLLFAGTEFGVFFSNDGGKKWIQLKGSLPTIAVMDIAIQKRENDLVLATFGRGFYILDNYSPLRHAGENNLKKDAVLFSVKDALMYIPSQPLGDVGKASQGESYFSAPNPPFGATFTYYLKSTIKTKKELRREKDKKLEKEEKPVPFPSNAELTAEDLEPAPYLLFKIYDENGYEIRELKTKAVSGIHRITWNLRYPSPDPATLKQFRSEGESDSDQLQSGMLAMPGTYKVIMYKNVDGLLTQIAGPESFKAEGLGFTSLPAENRTALVQFQKKVSLLSGAVLGSVNAARDLSKRISYIKSSLLNTMKASPDLMIQADSIKARTNNILLKLTGNKSLINRNINTLPSIRDRVQQIIYDEWQSTSAPTNTQENEYNIAADEFTPVLAQLKELLKVDIVNLQNKMESIGAPWTPGAIPEWHK